MSKIPKYILTYQVCIRHYQKDAEFVPAVFDLYNIKIAMELADALGKYYNEYTYVVTHREYYKIPTKIKRYNNKRAKKLIKLLNERGKISEE